MDQRKPEAVFREKIKAIDLKLKDLKKIESVLSFLKLLFVIGCIYFLFKIAAHPSSFFFYAFLFFLVVFVLTALIHERYIKQRNFQRTLKKVNQNEIKATQGDFLDYGDGTEFEDLRGY